MKNTPSDILHIDKSIDGIIRLTLNDQKNKNALSETMMKQLKDSIDRASQDKKIKVIIISSYGSVFCSGHNLKEIKHAKENHPNDQSYFLDLFNLCSSLMIAIVNSPKIVIAEVNGIATAAGCQLVATCDLAISSNASKFATPGVNIGLFCSTPMVALSRNASKKDSMKMLLTGDMIDAKTAKSISLINEHVSEVKLKKYVEDLAKKISCKSLKVLKIGKEAFYKQSELTLEEAYKYTSKVMTQNMMIEDATEGINAFLDKRDPNWTDS